MEATAIAELREKHHMIDVQSSTLEFYWNGGILIIHLSQNYFQFTFNIQGKGFKGIISQTDITATLRN